jgi:hypothetical protein
MCFVPTAAAKDSASGRMTYNPSSFLELVNDASAAALRAMADGKTRIEIEFPAVSGTECALCCLFSLHTVDIRHGTAGLVGRLRHAAFLSGLGTSRGLGPTAAA